MIELRSKTRRELLVYYFTNPAARLHLRELAKRLDLDPSNLSKELRRLEVEGLFRSETTGRQKYFELNRDYPLLREVRAIVMKTAGAVPSLSRALAGIPGIEEAWLYGSFAAGHQDALSDIDVLIIGTPRAEALAEPIRGLEKRLGREINYTVLTRKEFDQRRGRKDPFLQNVWQHKRIALTDPREEAQASHN